MVQTGTAYRKSWLVVLAVGVALVLSGCGALPALGSVVSSSSSQSGSSSAGSGATTNPEPANQNWTSRETDQEECDADAKTLTGIRVGRHDGFDRVVFDLSGQGAPCFRVFFDDNPVQDGSGLPVDLGGYQALRVEISALGPDFPTIDGGYRASLGGTYVSYALFDSFFEGVATSFIAVHDGNAQYAVDVLPGKLIIDVRTN